MRRRLRFFDSILAHRPLGNDAFLRQVSGVIHVGANVGNERKRYHRLGLHVVWLEPIPEIYERLRENIRQFPNQVAYQALLTDSDGVEHDLHVASNDGLSSSILPLGAHRLMWPTVDYDRSLRVRSRTLQTFIGEAGINLARYDALILDVQGAELKVLEGAGGLLQRFEFVKVEAADFEAYVGGCLLEDVQAHMTEHGFTECSRRRFKFVRDVGSYYDVVFVNDNGAS